MPANRQTKHCCAPPTRLGLVILQNSTPIVAALTAIMFLPGCGTLPSPTEDSTSGTSPEAQFFVDEIASELEIRCLECHNSKEKHKFGGLDLETRESLLTSGRHAPVILPGNGENSYLVQVLRVGHHDHRGMPPSPDKIRELDIEEIVQWIDDGAQWPEGFRLRRPEEW